MDLYYSINPFIPISFKDTQAPIIGEADLEP